MDVQVETDSLARAREISRTLFPHQVEGLAFLLGRRRSILADDMGLGKTRQSILGLTEAANEGPYLVVCPASVKRNWVREILMVLPEAETHISGPAPVPEPGFRGWVVLNYDILHRQVDALLAHDWKALVFDEAHYLKNHRSIRSRTATRIVAEAAGDPGRSRPYRDPPDQQAPGPVSPAPAGRPLAGTQLPLLFPALLQRSQERLRVLGVFGCQQRPGAVGAASRHHAAPHQGGGSRPSGQGANLDRHRRSPARHRPHERGGRAVSRSRCRARPPRIQDGDRPAPGRPPNHGRGQGATDPRIRQGGRRTG